MASCGVCVQPAIPLNSSTRYIVGVAGLVDDVTREPLVGWPSFVALRDGHVAPGVSPERAVRFDDEVFPVLEAAGMTRSSLQLAWDFTTG